jgi:hypothetical protein
MQYPPATRSLGTEFRLEQAVGKNRRLGRQDGHERDLKSMK